MSLKVTGRTSPLNKKGPCWQGYKMVGMKDKGGKDVPNCVPKDKGSPLKKLRKTTKGKGRHFLSAEEGAGMTEAGRKAYNKETGGNLKAPQPGGGKRQRSYCRRSEGQMKKWKINCKKTPKKRICAARRRWNC
jgi:hypothetical protein